MASRAASGREDEEGEQTMMKRPVMIMSNDNSEDYRNYGDNQVLATRLLLLHVCLKGCICFFPTAFDL